MTEPAAVPSGTPDQSGYPAHSSVAIANRFLNAANEEGQPLTPMKIQKLVYIAHGWHLGIAHQPFCSEFVEAWEWGPVFPALYHAVKHWGRFPIEEPILPAPWYYRDDAIVPPTVPDHPFQSDLFKVVWSLYGRYTGAQLSGLTHAKDTPWDVVRKQGGGPNAVIPDSLIRDHYKKKLSELGAS